MRGVEGFCRVVEALEAVLERCKVSTDDLVFEELIWLQSRELALLIIIV